MNMRTRSLLTIALTTALCAPVALAQHDTDASQSDRSQATSATSAGTQAADSKSAKGTSWADLDADGDGRISASEAGANAGFNSRFSVIDADGDGYASESEYRTYAATAGKAPSGDKQVANQHDKHHDKKGWADLDADGDGRISAMEASGNAGLDSSFSSIDSDSDGYLSDSEYRSHVAAAGSSDSAAAAPQWDAHSGKPDDGRAWSVMDSDRDGRISRAEVDGFLESFTSMDADGDGYVSNSEFTSHSRTASDTTATDDPDRAMGGVSSGQSTSVEQGTMAGASTDKAESQSSPQSTPPTQSQGAAHAAPHSAVVQRDIWNRLDTDGDGRISSVEASLDAGFSGNFSMTDADGDGFITAAEYRDHAQDMHRNVGGTRSQSSDTTKGTMDVDDDEYDDETTGDDGTATPPDDER